jgi:hypothetical protein
VIIGELTPDEKKGLEALILGIMNPGIGMTIGDIVSLVRPEAFCHDRMSNSLFEINKSGIVRALCRRLCGNGELTSRTNPDSGTVVYFLPKRGAGDVQLR